MAEEMFKTTLMGGFDKDDVLSKVQTMKDDAYAERSKLLKEGRAGAAAVRVCADGLSDAPAL